MKVDIQHNEVKKGFIKKKTYHQVTLTVQFSEEEKQIIADNDLRREVLVARERPADRSDGEIVDSIWTLEVFQLLKGEPDEYCVSTPAEAKQYEAKIKDALTNFKGHLDANKGIEEKSTSFEL